MALVWYMSAGIVVLVFLLFLIDGEFNDELQMLSARLLLHVAKKNNAISPRASTKEAERKLESAKAERRELNYLSDLVKLELYVLEAETLILETATEAEPERDGY